MKFLSYNIHEGARGGGQDRTALVLDVIRSADPDIVGLCECTDFWMNDGRDIRKFEQALSMRSVMNQAASGHHVALFYRNGLTILSADKSSVMMYHGFVRLVLNLPSIGRTSIIMTHLHPCSPTFRQGESENLLAKATFEPNCLIMGDLNALSESDQLPNLGSLSINERVRVQNARGNLDCGPASLFVRNGFIDLGATQAIPTNPTKFASNSGVESIRLRRDFMFATHAVAARARMTTICTAEAELASDHLPLLCDLKV